MHALRAQLACLEELLEVQEQVVAEQSRDLRAEQDKLRDAEAEARGSEERARMMMDVAYDAIICVDDQLRLQYWNASAERLFGFSEESRGRSFAEFVGDARNQQRFKLWFARCFEGQNVATREPLQLTLTTVASGDFLAECAAAQGTPGAGGNHAAPIVLFVRDVTVTRQLEADLQQAQKLEAVGRLASGVAHEINTPIQFVSDSVYFLRDAIKDLDGLVEKYQSFVRDSNAQTPNERSADIANTENEIDLAYLREELPKAIDRSLEGLNRVATIVRAMKEFAHPDQKEKAAIDLNRAIVSTLAIARNEYKYVADIETDYGNIPPVLCHGGDLNQAILNIIVNAAHAIGDVVSGTDKRGRISIRTFVEGNDVCIAISDTGGGISDAIRAKIFDPFFTTKAVGKGTGQGLAIARSVIVEKHGGQLAVDAQVGSGTTFAIRLPIVGSDPPHASR